MEATSLYFDDRKPRCNHCMCRVRDSEFDKADGLTKHLKRTGNYSLYLTSNVINGSRCTKADWNMPYIKWLIYSNTCKHRHTNTANPTPKQSTPKGKKTLELYNHTQTPGGTIKDMQSSFLFERGQWHFSLWSIMWHIRVVLKAEFSDNNRAAAVSISLDSAEIRLFSWPTLSSCRALVEKPLPAAVSNGCAHFTYFMLKKLLKTPECTLKTCTSPQVITELQLTSWLQKQNKSRLIKST